MASNYDKIRWQKTSDAQWTSNPERGYTATIDYAAGENPYTLTVDGEESSWPTLRNAKNAFRRFLSDKPVQ